MQHVVVLVFPLKYLQKNSRRHGVPEAVRVAVLVKLERTLPRRLLEFVEGVVELDFLALTEAAEPVVRPRKVEPARFDPRLRKDVLVPLIVGLELEGKREDDQLGAVLPAP